MTATRQDEKIARLIDEHGMAGYGVWWAVCEVVAARVESDSQPTVTYPVSTWSHLLSVRGSHVRQAILKLQVTGLLTAEWTGSDLTVTIPNLLKYRDEYTRRSGHCTDIVRSKKQKQNTEAETDTDTEKAAAPVGALILTPPEPKPPKKHPGPSPQIKAWLDAEFWPTYPKKVDKPCALRAAEKHATTPEKRDVIMAGLRAQLDDMMDNPKFIRNPGTWLNAEGWNDEPKFQVSNRPPEHMIMNSDEYDRECLDRWAKEAEERVREVGAE